MTQLRPKELFRQAKEAEAKGSLKVASAHYATLAAYMRRKGRIDDAATLIARAIRLSSKSPRLYLQQALVARSQKNQAAAEKAVETFARLVLDRGKIDEYRPYLEKILKDEPELRQVFYNRVLQIDRTTAVPFLAQAKTLMQQGKWEAAQRSLVDALKTKTADAEAVQMLEEVLTKRGQPADVEHLLSFQSGKLSRENLVTLLGQPSAAAEDDEEVPVEHREVTEEKNLNSLIRDLEAEIGLDIEGADSVAPLVKEFRRKAQPVLKGDSKTRLDMALAFFEMGLVNDARDELKPIDPSDPYYPESQALLGDMLFHEGSDLGALEAFQNCLRDERATVEMVREGKYKLLQIFFRLGDLKQALAQAKELEKLAPDYRELRQFKTRLLEALGNKT